jgi:hypothetical protein
MKNAFGVFHSGRAGFKVRYSQQVCAGVTVEHREDKQTPVGELLFLVPVTFLLAISAGLGYSNRHRGHVSLDACSCNRLGKEYSPRLN